MKRVWAAVDRRFQDLPHATAWNKNTVLALENKSRLVSFQEKHRGQRCFIMGNGPSLKNMDLRPLQNEVTFGLNRIYLLFDKLPFIPTYYVCVNELVLEQFAFEIKRLLIPKFLNWNRRAHFDSNDTSGNYLRLSLSIHDRFNQNIAQPFYSGGTVTYIAIQLAFIMGFSEVILLGVDHSFVDKGIPNKIETRTSNQDKNHFHPDYFPKGSKWQLPDLKRSELAYAIARKVFEDDKRKIIDATVNGKCPVFERVDFHSLF